MVNNEVRTEHELMWLSKTIRHSIKAERRADYKHRRSPADGSGYPEQLNQETMARPDASKPGVLGLSGYFVAA